mmetsp:Transcript_59943/g.106651  ORF Transcript_59943/g.106651 Transcript_59943/m.106651 type:complete len:205 (-) Transcript_59943:305-919(-)
MWSCCVAETGNEVNMTKTMGLATLDEQSGGDEKVFEAEINTNGDPSLGLTLDLADEELVLIREASGAAGNWTGGSNHLKVYDAIVSVNGDSVDSKDISSKLRLNEGVKKIGLGICRPVLTEVKVSKPGDLGITINYKKSSLGIWIATLKEGLVKKWNDENPDKAVRPHDRIIAVNGFSGDSAEIVDKLRAKTDTVTLMVMHYPK